MKRASFAAPLRILFAILSVAATVALIAYLLWSPARPAASPHAITVDLPPGSPLAEQNPHGTVVTDLASLPAPGRDNTLVAVGRFEPEGLECPDGLRIVWPLPARREPGSALWIMVLDADGQHWQGTGEEAVVLESGVEAAGLVYHFSVIGLADGPPPDIGEVALRCAAAEPDAPIDADKIERARGRLAVIAWKQKQKLLDYRPDLDAVQAQADSGDWPLLVAQQARNGAEASAEQSLQQWLAAKAAGALEPVSVLKNSFGVMRTALGETKRQLGDGPQTTDTLAEIKKLTQLAADKLKAQGSSSGPAVLDELDKQRQGLLAARAKAYAYKNELELSKKSVAQSLKRLDYLEKGVGLVEALKSDKPAGYTAGVMKALASGLEVWQKDALSDAGDLAVKKVFEYDRIDRQIENNIRQMDRHGGLAAADRRGLFYRKLAQGVGREGTAELSEKEAQMLLQAQAERKELLGKVKSLIGYVGTAQELYAQFKTPHSEFEKPDAFTGDLKALGSRLSERSQLFARYFHLVAAGMRKAADKMGDLPEFAPLAALVSTSAEEFELVADAPLIGARLQRAFAQGGKLTRNAEVYYGVALFEDNRNWGLTVYQVDDNHYVVPGPNDDERTEVHLSKEQYENLLRAASNAATLKDRNPTQQELNDLAGDLKSAPPHGTMLTYQGWEDYGFRRREKDDARVYHMEQGELVNDEARRDADEEIGKMLLRHADISRALTAEEAAEISLDKLRSLQDTDENKAARHKFAAYNRLWMRLDEMWRAVHGVPLPRTIFGAIAQKEKEREAAGLQRTPENISALEKRLIEAFNAMKNRPAPPPAEVLLVNARRRGWDRMALDMTYQTSGLTEKNQICRYFRVRLGDGDWRELNPSRVKALGTGAEVEAVWTGLTPDDLDKGEATVQGVVEIDQKPYVQEQTVELAPVFRFESFDVYPTPLTGGGPALFSLMAYVDEDFAPGQAPRVEFTLDGLGDGALKATVDPADVVFFNGHTLYATGWIKQLPSGQPKGDVTANVTVSLADHEGAAAAAHKFTRSIKVDYQAPESPPPEPTPPQGAGREITLVLDRLKYHIRLNDRDEGEEKGELKNKPSGQIPFSYENKWATGHSNMNGSLEYVFPTPLRVEEKFVDNTSDFVLGEDYRATARATAHWDTAGFGFDRRTGLEFGTGPGETQEKAFRNGEMSAEVKTVKSGRFHFYNYNIHYEPDKDPEIELTEGAIGLRAEGDWVKSVGILPVYKVKFATPPKDP